MIELPKLWNRSQKKTKKYNKKTAAILVAITHKLVDSVMWRLILLHIDQLTY